MSSPTVSLDFPNSNNPSVYCKLLGVYTERNVDEQNISPIIGLVRDFSIIFNNVNPIPKKGSPADIEIRSFRRAESVKSAFSQATLALESAADHLAALDALVRSKQYAIAPGTCARGVLEASSIATWLLDPQIDVQERVGRSLSLRYETLLEQEKLARADDNKALISKIQDRIVTVEKIAVQLGFEALRGKKNQRKGIAQVKSGITELVQSQFGRGKLYRLLSGMAHSSYTTLSKVTSREIAKGQSGNPILQRTVDEKLQLDMVATAATIYTRGAWFCAIQFGLDAARMAVILETRYNELNLADTNKIRFWRTVIEGHDSHVITPR